MPPLILGAAILTGGVVAMKIGRKLREAAQLLDSLDSVSSLQRQRAGVCPVCFTIPCACASRAAAYGSDRAAHRLRNPHG